MSHHPQDHFDAGSIAFASNADCDRATVLFSQLANALQSEQLKNREAADALDAQAERIKALEGALRDTAMMLEHAITGRNGERYGFIETRSGSMMHAQGVVEKLRALLGEK